MSVIGTKCDHAKHRECPERLGAVTMLNGQIAVLECDCTCHEETVTA